MRERACDTLRQRGPAGAAARGKPKTERRAPEVRAPVRSVGAIAGPDAPNWGSVHGAILPAGEVTCLSAAAKIVIGQRHHQSHCIS
jgi:hypothetical protein